MIRYLFDSDAWICARALHTQGSTILNALLASAECTPILLTDYIGRHELSQLAHEIQPLLDAGKVILHGIAASDENYARLKRRVHKGEAGAIAWLLASKTRRGTVFVTRDRGAALTARDEGVLCADVLGLVVDMIEVGAIHEAQARVALSLWDDKSQQVCRPSDWAGFDASLIQRQIHGFPFFRVR